MFEKRLDRLADIRDELDRTLEEVPALDSTRGRIIRVGIDAELDRMREIHDNAQGWLERFEQTQRSSTGINSLKVKYNRAFGFSIEVSRANAGKVPAFYQRRQTLVNGERYVTEDLLAFERDWLRAQETVVACEQRIFGGLVQRVREQATSLIELGEILAEWDVTQACAYLVSHKKFVLPEFVEDSRIELDGSRHPVLEKLEEPFVANDVCLDSSQRFLLLTGPNMSGKSTLMRQVGLATLSAYAGLPVAASRGVFGPVDSIFTRVGASDRLSKRQSTFMVEMIETATILRQATAKSLVIIDEIGRGTSTFDGMSIAWAVAEEIITALRPLTMFATHYHELVGLERAHDTVRTGELAIKEWEGEIIFLRKFQYGSSGKSYGINVARLAGLPPAVLERAAKKLEELSRSPRAQMPLPF
jgi:DNA mismatch repair protein MutS